MRGVWKGTANWNSYWGDKKSIYILVAMVAGLVDILKLFLEVAMYLHEICNNTEF